MAIVPIGDAVIDIVESTLPPGYEQTVGTDPTTVTVPEGGTATDIDGYQIPSGKLEGVVYLDTNGNGSQGPNEPGIEDVNVVVTDSLGIVQTLTTDSNGEYSTDLPIGPAVTNIVQSTLPDGVVQTGGSDPTTVVVPEGGTATDSDGFQLPTDPPTKSPTRPPTTSPTKSPTVPPTPGGGQPTPGACVNVNVDFETGADGNPLAPGDFIENQYAEYGLILSSSGGETNLPRLFDSANPGSQETCGDEDLGSPNEACTPSGPGVGGGGAPGEEGENCVALGNILIIQEPDVDCPDDNADGGMIIFDFVVPAEEVLEMTFLDIDYETSVTVTHDMDDGMEAETVFDLPLLGDNSKQTLEINIQNVKQVKVTFTSSGAVTDISFCYNPVEAPTAQPGTPTGSPTALPQSPTASPTKDPTTAPTKSPTTSPTASPTRSPTASLTASPTKSPTAAPTPKPTGTVTGTVFKDVNNNGEQDPGEPGIPNVDVVITDSNNDKLTLTTDSNGEYSAKVPVGSTVIDIVENTLPPGYVQTVGTDPTTVVVPAEGTATDLDGYFIPTDPPTKSPTASPTSSPTKSPTAAPTPKPTGTVTGTVFKDVNNNGEQDPGEPGIPNVDVVITDSNNDKLTLTTDSNGEYSAKVPVGPTVIDIVESTLPPGYVQTVGTDPTTVVVPAEGTATDLDGYFIPTDPPTKSPTASPTSSPTASPTKSPTNSPTASPTAAPTPTLFGKVKGVVFWDKDGDGAQDPNEPGIPNVDVVVTDNTGSTQTITTDDEGMYMAMVPIGSAEIDIVESTLPDEAVQTAGTDPTTVTVPEGGTATDIDGYVLPSGKIEGVVYLDTNGNGSQGPNEPGIENVNVVITDSLGIVQTLTTDSDGEYSAVVPSGPVVTNIVESTLPDGAVQTEGSNPTTVVVPEGGTATDRDGYTLPTDSPTKSPTSSPTKNPTTSPTASPTSFPTKNPTTSPTASPTASPTKNPTSSPTASPTASPTKAPTAAPTPTSFGKVKGIVYWDKDGDGTKDPNEPGLPDVNVVVTDNTGETQTVTTDMNGEYMAMVPTGPAGIDIVESTLPPGYEQTEGTNPTRVNVPELGTATDIDGYKLPSGKLEGIVFEDTNGDGEKNPSEPGIAGVQVVVTDSAGIVQTLTTDKDGVYTTEVPAGPAVTDIVESTLPDGAVQTAGEDPTTVIVPEGGTATDIDGYQLPTEPPTKAPTASPTISPPTTTTSPTKQPTPSPTPRPTREPTPVPPTAAPTPGQPTPGGGCINVDVDFETDAEGNPLAPGEYLQNQFAEYGLIFSASGGVGTLPRLFDSANPGSQETCGDADLGR